MPMPGTHKIKARSYDLAFILCVPGMGIVYRVKVPNTEGDIGVSLRQGCPL